MAFISLTEGDDVYTSTTPGDVISGLGGNDTITASDGGNGLYGGDGEDTLNGGAGNDTLWGDNSTLNMFHNVLNGRGGDDLIVSNSWYDQISAGSGNDYVQVYAMTTGQIVDGGSNVDTIDIRALGSQTGNIHIVMGATFSPTVDAVQGATYTNFEVLNFTGGGSGSCIIEGGAYNDTIIANFTDTFGVAAGALYGGGGDDHLEFNGLPTSGTGVEAIDGGDGTDTLFWSNGSASFAALNVDASNGKMKESGTTFATFAVENLNLKTFAGATGTVSINGGAGADTLFINASTTSIASNGGNDNITIDSGAATVDAGDGDDAVHVTFANGNAITVHGGLGNDSIGSGSGQSQLFGEDGNDNLSALNGRTSLNGGSGDDTLYNTSSYSMTGTGSAILDGGGGRDYLSIERSLGGTTYTADFTQSSVTLGDGTQILHCEAVAFVASSGNDVLTASNDAGGYLVNKLYGLGGDDVLIAGSNGAWLDGSIGNNMLIAGAGVDKLLGGTADYENSNKGVTVDLTLGLTPQTSKGYANGDIVTALHVTGSAFADRLTGNTSANTLSGGDGNDKLKGGAGHDTLAGGVGKDVFIYGAVSESTGAGYDSVTDFDAKQDKFQVLSAVTQIDNAIGSGSLNAASFDTDLATALSNHLKGNHAMLFTPDAGDLAGKTFLIVDQNGQVAYQTGADIVLDITGATHLGNLAVGDFVV